MSNILHIGQSFDPAGDVVRCVTELKKYSRHNHEVFIKRRHPLQAQYGFPEAAFMGWNTSETTLIHLIHWADAVIYHFIGSEGTPDLGRPTAFRNSNIYYDAVAKKFFAVGHYTAKSLDGLKLLASSHMAAGEFLPGCRFLPAMIPINDALYTPSWNDRKPCLAYIKHAEFIDHKNLMIDKLNLSGCYLSNVLCLRRSLATVVLDNVTEGHYGLVAMEAMSQGLPAIVNNAEVTREQLRGLGEMPPFIEVGGLRDIPNAVADMVMTLSTTQYLDLRKSCREWAEKYYHSKRMVEMYWDTFCDELVTA